jgi:hypothetical protein
MQTGLTKVELVLALAQVQLLFVAMFHFRFAYLADSDVANALNLASDNTTYFGCLHALFDLYVITLVFN